MKSLILLLGLVLALCACEKPRDELVLAKASTVEVQRDAKEIVITLTDQAKQEREEFVSKAQKDMYQFAARMASLKKKGTGGERRVEGQARTAVSEPRARAEFQGGHG